MGTPPFAVASLDALLRSGIEVVAVVTAPDKPAGRGQQLRMSAVKEYALTRPELKERILQPEKLKDATFHEQLDAAGADLYVVVAFRMLPEAVWIRPRSGTINLHGSLLPDYRGAAPINWAVMNGETLTGATTFFIRHEIDTGDMIDRIEVPIGPDETAGEVHDRLMVQGADLLVRTVQRIFDGSAQRQPQLSNGHAPKHAPKLTPENCRIDWRRDARAVHDHIRGLSPYPGAWARLVMDEHPAQHFKILRARVAYTSADGGPGTVILNERQLIVRCGGGAIEALEIQPEGKRRMDTASFLRGLRGSPTLRFE